MDKVEKKVEKNIKELVVDEFNDLVVDIDDEEDDNIVSTKLSDVVETVLWGADWTVETIVSQIEKNNINLNPSFQRRIAWSNKKKSQFIESLILGLPVPEIILAESRETKGKYIVIDGKQRLFTLLQFFRKKDDSKLDNDKTELEPLILTGLEILHNLNGKSFVDLQEQNGYKAQLENSTIRTVVIKKWPTEEVLYTIFLRINTGSQKLSPQELRQALVPGEFTNFADKYTITNVNIMKMLKNNVPDIRMRDVESIIRYFAFSFKIKQYDGRLKEFLDNICRYLNDTWSDNKDIIHERAEKMGKAIDLTIDIFNAKSAFSRYKDGKYMNRFNKAIADIMLYYFSIDDVYDRVIKSPETKSAIKLAFENLCTNDEYFTICISNSTHDFLKTQYRFYIWQSVISDILNVELPSIWGSVG